MSSGYSPNPSHVKPGQGVRFSVLVSTLGALTNVSPLTLTLEPPAGAPDSPIVDPSPVNDSAGAYHSDQTIPFASTPGLWVARWQAAGGAPATNALSERRFYVDALDF